MPTVRTSGTISAYAGSAATTTFTSNATPVVGDVVVALACNDDRVGPPTISGGSGTWTSRHTFAQGTTAGADIRISTRPVTVAGAQAVTATNPAIDSGVFLFVIILTGANEVPVAVNATGSPTSTASSLPAPALTGVLGSGILINVGGTGTGASAPTITAPGTSTSSLLPTAQDTANFRCSIDGSPPAAGVSSGTRTFTLSAARIWLAASVLFEDAAVTASPGQFFLGI